MRLDERRLECISICVHPFQSAFICVLVILMFEKVLVANRGEIALRIMRTCARLGVPTVAVYSDGDRAAPHVLAADEAVRLGPAEPSESYLSVERIRGAARDKGAEAIQPGQGCRPEP